MLVVPPEFRGRNLRRQLVSTVARPSYSFIFVQRINKSVLRQNNGQTSP